MPHAKLYILSAALHGFVAWRLVPALMPWPWAALVLAAVLCLSAIAVPSSLIGRRRSARSRAAMAWAWTGLLGMGLFSTLFVLTLLRDALLLLAWLAQSFAPGLNLASPLALGSALAVAVGAMVITLVGLRNARRTARVVDVMLPVHDLPAALHGFSIVQISDVHVGPTIRGPYVQGIVDAVNRLEADMVAITGDLVDGSVPELAAHVAPLAGLRSRHGSYFVTGNHEYYAGAAPWIAELRRLGLRVLLNEHVVLQHGEAALVVAGVTDSSAHHFDPSHRSDPAAALAGAPARALVRLLLAHQPRSAEAAEKAGFDVQLSGHTHGGQFLPWNFFVRLQQPFTAGLHRMGRLLVYTSRGTGYWGPPKRFGAPSEITHLRLVAA